MITLDSTLPLDILYGNNKIDTSRDDLHIKANLLRLKFRREQHILNHMFDVAQVQSNLKPANKLSVKTRSSAKKLVKCKRPITEKFRKCLAYLGPKKWNNLPTELQHAQDKYTYKSLVSDWIGKKAILASDANTANNVSISVLAYG